VFVAQAAASATLGLLISFSLLLVVALGLGRRPTAYWLLLPVPLVALQALGFALGLLCGTLNVFFRDVGQLLTVVLQVVMWTVPVVYLAEYLPDAVRPLLRWHPLYPPLAAIRELFLEGRAPPTWTWPAMLAWPAGLLLLAGVVFSRLRKEIRDVL
jgi:lipopolysaccharide transport system permease protein